jgi:hypothetical protein
MLQAKTLRRGVSNIEVLVVFVRGGCIPFVLLVLHSLTQTIQH